MLVPPYMGGYTVQFPHPVGYYIRSTGSRVD